MKMSIEGLVALMKHEGIVQSRYKDSVGVWTIGVGHTKAAGGIDPATYKGTLTLDEVVDLLTTDIVKYENGVNKVVKVPLKQHQFDALVSWHYNTGGATRPNSGVINAVNAKKWLGVEKDLMSWKKPPEIIPRRKEEAALFRDGIYPAPLVTVYPASAAGQVQWKKGKTVDARSLLAKKTSSPAVSFMPSIPEPTVYTDKDKIAYVQSRLRELGYTEVGSADGRMGPMTRTAILAFRSDNVMPLSEKIDDQLLTALGTAEKRQLLRERTEASAKMVRDIAPETRANWKSKIASAAGAIGTGSVGLITGVTDQIQSAQERLAPVQDWFASIPGWVYLLVVAAVSAAIWYISKNGEKAGVEAVRDGSRR